MTDTKCLWVGTVMGKAHLAHLSWALRDEKKPFLYSLQSLPALNW